MNANLEIAIDVKNISKSFQISDTHGLTDFLALDNISFTLYRGEIMGIIGSNGSGKSTLLKILGEVIKPSSGTAELYGNVTSILEVGDNFHPDLSGRENVNIRLKLRHIPSAQFKEFHKKIKDFSEIGDFYEQPIKTYSAGMFLRLAFSVALQLSSDVLLLDEVLSVGDEGFRLKCRELLLLLASQGKTILFVSHNRIEVQELANRCLWLHKGCIRKEGRPAEILGEYFLMHKDNHDAQKKMVDVNPFLHENSSEISIDWPEENAPGNDIISIRHISVSSACKENALYNTNPILLKLVVNKKMKGQRIGPFFFLQDMFYQPVLVGHFLNNPLGGHWDAQTKDATGMIEITCTIPSHFLIPGKYYLSLRIGIESNEWSLESPEALRFSETLSFALLPGSGYTDFVGDAGKGAVRPLFDWNINKQEN